MQLQILKGHSRSHHLDVVEKAALSPIYSKSASLFKTTVDMVMRNAGFFHESETEYILYISVSYRHCALNVG